MYRRLPSPLASDVLPVNSPFTVAGAAQEWPLAYLLPCCLCLGQNTLSVHSLRAFAAVGMYFRCWMNT
jgi:hypothetical protein